MAPARSEERASDDWRIDCDYLPSIQFALSRRHSQSHRAFAGGMDAFLKSHGRPPELASCAADWTGEHHDTGSRRSVAFAASHVCAAIKLGMLRRVASREA